MKNLIHVNWNNMFFESLLKPKFLKILAFALLLVFLGTLITYKIPLPAAEDLPRQMANGKDILQGNFDVLTTNYYAYTQPDHYFANHHWLYGVFVYILHAIVGWNGMVVFKIVFILLTFAILFRAALHKADFWFVAVTSIPAIFMLAGRSGLRPELFGYFFVAIYIYLLLRLEKHTNSKAIYWLVPMQILWANLHITFPIGVMIVGGFLVEKIILHSAGSFRAKFTWVNFKSVFGDSVIRKLSVLIIILSVVSFANPLGIRGVIYSLTANIGSDSPVRSAEVQAVSSTIDDLPKKASIPFALVAPLIYLLAISFAVGFRKKQVFYFLACVGVVVLAVKVLRGAPFLGIFFMLAFPANLNDLFLRAKGWVANRFSQKINFETISSLVVIIGLVIFMSLNYTKFTLGREVGIGLERNAEDSANFFIGQDLKGPIFNDTDSGSYLIYYLNSREKVYTDNRFGDAYTDEFFQDDYVAAVTNETQWQKTLNKYQFNSIFMYQYDQGYNMRDFMFRRIQDPEWAWVYGDRFNIILVRNIEENWAVIDKYGITVENAQERFRSLTKTLDGNDLVAAADLFALMGQSGWALAQYELAVAQHPEWAKIWFVMGKMELQKNDRKNSSPALAALFLEQAIARGWKTTNSYSFLALAYYRMGQIDKAKEAVAEELKINPKSEDAKLWLNTFTKYDAEQLNK